METQGVASERWAPLHLTSEQDAADFINSSPNPERVRALRREELLLVAQKLELAFESSNAFPLANLICHHLCGTDLYDFVERKDNISVESEWSVRSEVLGSPVVKNNQFGNDQAARDHEFRMLQLESEREERRAQLEFERERLESEREQKKLEFEQRKLELELEKHKVDHEPRRPVVSGVSSEQHRLVPKFDEDHVAEFFQRFEKIAEGSGWPKERWSTLAQSVFCGKALRAFDALSFQESLDYETLKSAVLRTYELRPEAYRQKYRNSKKRPNETWTEFMKYQSDLFLAWIRSEKLEYNYCRLEELVKLEQFLSQMEPDLQMFISDKRVKTAEEAAVYADDYVLVRKQFKAKDKGHNRPPPTTNN
ncbi:hypothetical protein Pcinc_016576 [Petrolisthes cinctipes]|uniref:SCAN box domain-containing protein n=2 Tax=Petrolisthes cinctipes TaxID=88211 RepID=A0AAE1FSG1_PETCI|nr:hypothetical protein Pcinc_016576 [Petrolisthes cinctipes]